MPPRLTTWIAPVALLAVAAAGTWAWRANQPPALGEGLVQGNGRIEATEIDIATKQAGRVAEVLVAEGDWVQAGALLARMDTAALQAQQREAVARHAQAEQGVASAHAQVAVHESDLRAAQAQVVVRTSELDAAQRRLTRSSALAREGASSQQELDDDRAREHSARAALHAAQAQADAARAAVQAARTQVTAAQAQVQAALASVQRLEVELQDATLTAPRDGRVQLRLATAGEVLGAGGRVLHLVDLSDVYMTFFLPETVAGQVAIGSEARIVLDATPQWVIPATIRFVSATAQFTPKTVETANERQKLMFRVRAHIDPQLLRQHLDQVKTGLPGVTWVKLDAQAPWPEALQPKLPPPAPATASTSTPTAPAAP